MQVNEGTRDGAIDGLAIGTAIVSYIEPHAGSELEFNRWYERDHFPAAVLAGPGAYAGARFVATRACKVVRADANLLGDPHVGSYLSAAWLLPGAQPAWDAWIPRQMETLVAESRMFAGRDHLHTAVYDFAFEEHTEGTLPASFALDAGYAGVIAIAVLDGDDQDALQGWASALLETELPLVVALHRQRLLVSTLGEPAPHSLLLVFVIGDVLDAWVRVVAPAVAGRGDIGFAGPFLATVPGTDTYVDRL